MAWQRVCDTNACPLGESREFVVGDRIVAIFNVQGVYYALDGICPHQGGPLGKGYLNSCIVTCPWHGFQFDVTTGQHQTSQSLQQTCFEVKLEEGGLWVDLEEPI